MEIYKLGKTIENQDIEIHLLLQQLNEARDSLRSLMKRRKEIAMAKNDTQYKEIGTTQLFADGSSYEFDTKIVDLMDKNRAQAEEIRNLKLEQESQAILLCEVTEKKNKAIEEKGMIEKEKRILSNRLEEK